MKFNYYYSIIQSPRLHLSFSFMPELDSKSLDELIPKALEFSFDEEDFIKNDYKLCYGYVNEDSNFIVTTIFTWDEPHAKEFGQKLYKVSILK